MEKEPKSWTHDLKKKKMQLKGGSRKGSSSSAMRARGVRREKKINEKMRLLKDLVPGCHKEMGTAGMVEEIVRYVHSLHNQVECLSMRLAEVAATP